MSFHDQLEPVDTVIERSVGPYRLLGEPGHAEGGSLLFEGEGPGGEHASVQVAAAPVSQRRVRARFRRLAGKRAELSHPALLPVREVGEDHGRLFVVTDKRPSATLAGLLGTGPLDPRTVLELLTAAAAGLDAAHGRGLVHQTLGADSLLLPDGGLQLDLFGLFMLVRQAGWGDVVRRAPHVAYESPEALRGEQPTPASNVYSLAGVLVHALTGQEPYPHSDPMLIHSAHFSDPPPSPSERVEALGTDLDDVVARGMAKDPSERPASAGELIEQARAALALRRGVAAPPVLPVEPEIEPEPEPEVAAPEPPPAGDPPSQAPAPMLEAWLLPEGETAAPPPEFAESSAPTQPLVAAPAKPPLAQRVRPWLPLIAIVIVAAAFGALLASPGSDPEPAPQPSAPRADARAVASLDVERVRLRDELALAETPGEQVAAAEGLARAHRAAAGDVSDEALGGALDDVAAAYDDLAAAARSGDEAAYAAASEDVASADEALASALRTR